MFSFFRRGVTAKIMLVILGIGLFAIVVTGFGTDGMGGMGGASGSAGGETLVEIGGEKITAAEMTDQVNRQLAAARAQQPELDMATFLRSGAYETILQQLTTQKAMLAFGREQGLSASKRMIDGEIASIPGFKNLAGQFDRAVFDQALQRERLTEEQLRRELAASLMQRQTLLPVAASARVPEALAVQYASLLLEQRSGTVGLVAASAMGAGREPSDAEVQTYFRGNQARYTIPERRVLRYAMVGPEQVAAAARPTDVEIAKVYQANQDRYGAKETRTLSQVVLPDLPTARTFASRMSEGASFEQAAKQAGFGPSDIAVGKQTKAEFTKLTSAAVANAAFAAARGAVTAPLQSPLGWHIVRVEAVNSTPATPLAAARSEIERQLAERKQAEALGTLITKIEDALAEGSSFDEVARGNGLAVQQTPAITGSGVAPNSPGFRAPPELAPLLKAGFEMAAEDDPVVETIAPNQRFAMLAVGQVVPAAPPPLAQIIGIVKGDLVRQRAADRAKAVATAIAAKINAGMPARQAFAGAGVPLQAPQPISARRLDIARPDQPVPPPLAMMFSLPKGKARMLAAPNGQGWFVVHLEQTVPGDASKAPELVQATRGQFQRFLSEEYAAQFTRGVEKQLEVERDERAIARLKQSLLGGSSAQ
jgi:peptidyl-prolyl cis-trans isomerase D